MPPTRRQPPSSTTGSGGLAISGLAPGAGGAGESVQDTTPGGFSAIITGQPDPTQPAYSFIICDDSAPPVFAQLAGAYQAGDGVSLAAFERSGSLTVPTNSTAVVWLEPLRLGVGYGFTYSTSAPLVYGVTASQGSNWPVSEDDEWQDTSEFLPVIDLPAAGVYLITYTVPFIALVSAFTGANAGQVATHLVNVSTGVSLPGSTVFGAPAQVAGQAVVSTGSITVPHEVGAPTTIRIDAWRNSGVTWELAQIAWTQGLVIDADVLTNGYEGEITITYLKVG